MIPTEQLVRRIAVALRSEVAPATEGAIPRSQAYRASAILHRLSRQLELADAHRAAEDAERRLLAEDLRSLLASTDAPAAMAAAAALRDGDHCSYRTALASLVAALYDDRGRLADETHRRALRRVRLALRAELDRRLDVAT